MPPRRGYDESFGVDLDQLDRMEEHEALTGGVRRTRLIREMNGVKEAPIEGTTEKEDKSPVTFRYKGVL